MTERTSLRQDAENELINKSVWLDYENKVIRASMPMRGPEENFLASNRSTAKRVLDGVCKKLAKTPGDIPSVQKSVHKLFDKNHAVLVKDLPEDVRKKFEDKPVQHYMCWRVVYNPKSVTTPVRPVMDASTNTPGKRCLNDLVVKGHVNSLNLVQMVLRHSIGRAAVAGDLSQFYNALKLEAEFYNLQRFLWRENLGVDEEVLEAVITTLIYGVKSVSAQSEEAM